MSDKNDLLRRQDCIEAIEGITCSMSLCVNADECHGMKRMQRQAILEIANMPAAQPEIVRCKDCKHYLHDEEYGFDWCNRMSGVFRAKPDGFCSWAVMRGGDSNE